MSDKPKFYITTPIYYPSGNLHIGHAYTTVAADSMTRYKKLRGYDCYFLTGTDEHGQKIQRRAHEAGKTPQQFVDEIVSGIKDLWQVMGIEYNDFIRTTEPRHEKVAQQLFQKIYDQGDIYKAEYSGWYCSPCETFFTERQLAAGHLCPDCGRPVEVAKEESYFFKMSKYADRWLQFIEDNPDFIQPVSRRNEMVSFVKQGLEDLCVSRTTFDWGIKVPFDDKHVIYVWFDALINYISALGYGTEDDSLYQKFWPADIHLMAKDIIRFHSVIWPIMLMAADIPIPTKVIAHGWVTLGEDGKMSKSKGNVVDPVLLTQKYGLDAIRYFLMREMPCGLDVAYSEEILVNRINVDLANDYGNLLSRANSMLGKFQGGVILPPTGQTAFDADLIALAKATPDAAAAYFDKLDFAGGLAEVWKLVGAANKYIDDTAPWALNKAGDTDALAAVLYNLCEVLRFVTVLVSPVMINVRPKVFEQLGIATRDDLATWDSLTWGAFPAGVKVSRGVPIFPRIDFASVLEEEATAAATAPFPGGQSAPARDIEPLEPQISIDDFAKVDLRIVKVLDCQPVPKSKKLLQFTLKMGDEVRTVVSGIAKYYQPQDLIGKNLVLVANLKPAVLCGVESNGMLLSAVTDDTLELLQVSDALDGTKVR